MRFGVVFPQTEIGTDPAVIRDFAQTAEGLGYHHILAYDHVIGVNPASRQGWRPPYTHKDSFHEPFVLFSYLAGVTKTLEFTTGVIILPQRQTVLVAKQAAALDVLSGGRLRLGIGIGWNPVEYEALGENFKNRGRRSEEQVEVLRQLWTQELVTYEGQWHRITDAGLNPLPIQRPIPIWFGGSDDRALRRLARLGDGWFPMMGPHDTCRAAIDKIGSYAREAGRDPKSIGIESRVMIGQTSPEEWKKEIEAWKNLGATHLAVNTMKAGLPTPTAHIEAIRRVKAVIS
ncbi:MAG TPA: LLM class F420-dependent oxidoreductase [Candidatus Acidoferrales bacterium]|nr:LLM class F420-dependent oxidoreductase [Candidatus Acidoferrales bacterium]